MKAKRKLRKAKPYFTCKGFEKMPKKTQDAIVEMVRCMVVAVKAGKL